MAFIIVCSYIEAMEDSMEDFQKFDTAEILLLASKLSLEAMKSTTISCRVIKAVLMQTNSSFH